MAIYLGHTTAQRILESRLALQLEPVSYHIPHEFTVGKREVEQCLRHAFGYECPQPWSQLFFDRPGEPLDLLIDTPSSRRRWSGVNCHLIMDNLPSESFMQLDVGIFVASPALCLIQQAQNLSRIGLIKLAMSFCGIYQLEGDIEREPFSRKPITTPQEIMDYLGRAEGMKGVQRVADAMKWVLPNSGSPMETRMVLPLYLSRHLGGYGLPRPSMNAAIRLSDEATLIAGQRHCFADALWIVKGKRPFIEEYQSRENHDIAEKYGSDYGRQLALQHDRYTVQFVTSVQLNSPAQLNELARLVAKHTGTWLPDSAYKWDDLRTKMNQEVQS